VPHDRIKAAVNHMTSEYIRNHGCPLQKEDIVFSAQLSENSLNNDQRIFRGRTRKPGQVLHEIWLTDIDDLVDLMLQLSFFTSLGICYSQIRGACIGAPASPVICNIAAAFEEHVWIKAFNLTWFSATKLPAFFSRYVDNRACIIHTSDMSPAIRQLTSLDFYRPPVQLEEVGDNVFLGFEVKTNTKTITYIPPQHGWQFRSPQSAGTTSLLLGSLSSRLHLIARGTFPKDQAKKAAVSLCGQYVDKGFSLVNVENLRKQVMRPKPTTCSATHVIM
jgi:hypothetical protein